jgi:hypothetical protein
MIGDEFSSRMNHHFLGAIESGDDKGRDILPAGQVRSGQVRFPSKEP